MKGKLSKTYTTAEEIEAVVRGFESCATAPSQFHHLEHLTVALWYLMDATETEALARLRANLLRFLAHHGVGANVYHETVTLFWLKRVRGFLSETNGERPLAAIANELIRACGDTRLIDAYFSKERLESEAARQGWVEPDVQPLDF